MYCRNCGKEISENVSFCPNCGHPVLDKQADEGARNTYRQGESSYEYGSTAGQNHGEPYQYGDGSRYDGSPYQYQQQQVKEGPDGYAIASLILGILAFFILPLIGGILAIVFGNKSIRENGMNTMARVGKILGIIALVLMIVMIVLIVIAMTMFGIGAFGAMGYYL